ncbi:hypothetical protein MD484_g8010, partial [Candolleomyces efflorescens]
MMLTAKVPLSTEALKTRLSDWAATSSTFPFFKGSSADLTSWFAIVEQACEENEIIADQYSEAAIALIQGDLAHAMEERRLQYLEKSGDTHWRWEEFKEDIRRVVLEAEKIMADTPATPLGKTKEAVENLRSEHPYIFASASAGLMIGGSVVIIPALGVLSLNALGLTTVGVAGAVMQSIFYHGATAGLSSIFRSNGAKTAAPTDSSEPGADSPSPGPSDPPNSPVKYAVYQPRKRRAHPNSSSASRRATLLQLRSLKMTRIVPLSSETLRIRLLHWATTSSSYPFFKGSSKDLTSWFSIVERACEENEIVDVQYSEAAIVFIQGDLAHAMEERQLRYLEKSGNPYWGWDEFKDDIRRVILEAEKIVNAVMADKPATPLDKTKAAFENLRAEHPYIFASAGAGLMIGGSFVIIPALGVLALNAIGFTSAGVAGGSFAAVIQSIFYRGATAGLFSMLQSAGATAVMPAVGSIVGATSAIGAGVASLVYGHGSKKDSEGGSSDSSEESSDSPPPPYPGDPHSPVTYAVYQRKRDKSPPPS